MLLYDYYVAKFKIANNDVLAMSSNLVDFGAIQNMSVLTWLRSAT